MAKWLVAIIIISFLVGFRFLFLDRFPAGLDHDEAMYSLNGESYIQTGKDLSATVFPLSIFRSKTEGNPSVMPSLILSFYYRFLAINQFNV